MCFVIDGHSHLHQHVGDSKGDWSTTTEKYKVFIYRTCQHVQLCLIPVSGINIYVQSYSFNLSLRRDIARIRRLMSRSFNNNNNNLSLVKLVLYLHYILLLVFPHPDMLTSVSVVSSASLREGRQTGAIAAATNAHHKFNHFPSPTDINK